MPITFTFPLLTVVPATVPPTPGVPVPTSIESDTDTSFLGFGILTPFQRDGKNDFAHGGGPELVKSSVRQILMTRGANAQFQGELPWRTEFGSLLHLLRHQNNDDILAELAQVSVVEALDRWEPRVQVTEVTIERQDSSLGESSILLIKVKYDIIQQNVPGNLVVFPNQTVTAPISLAA